MLDTVFGSNPGIMRSNYLDMYKGVHTDVVCTNRFDESSNLTMTYLVKTKMTKETKGQGRREISNLRTRLYFGKTVIQH